MIVHRVLKWALANPQQSPPAIIKPPVGVEAALYSTKHLEEIAQETSETERRAATAERELKDWKTAQFMEQHLGDEYEGLIISIQKYGCFVELLEVFVEGLLPISALEEASGSRVMHREREHSFVTVPGGSGQREGGYGGKGGSKGSQSGQRKRGQAGEGRGKKSVPLTWKLGDRIRVRAERIDPMRHRVEFALVLP